MLRVVSIFTSIDGEVNRYGQGGFSTFIRLAGCNINCWGGCDTPQAMSRFAGEDMSPQEIVHQVALLGPVPKVTITGGEPLLQKDVLEDLLADLQIVGIKVSVETNGTLPWDLKLPHLVDSWVVDRKMPSTKHHAAMLPLDYLVDRLTENDWVKFVIADQADFDVAVEEARELVDCGCRARIAFSGKHGAFHPAQIVEGLTKARFFVPVVNVQLHKLIWPLAKREV